MDKWKITIIITFMLSLWCIDVSVTTLNLGIMTNGFFNLDPSTAYHLGLYIAIISFVALLFMNDWETKKIRGK